MFCLVLFGGDAVPGGGGVEGLARGLQEGAVSSVIIQDHARVDGCRTDGRVLQHKTNATQKHNTALFNTVQFFICIVVSV